MNSLQLTMAFFTTLFFVSTVAEAVNECGPQFASLQYSVGQGARAFATSDIDADGDVDLAVVNDAEDKVIVLRNEGDGSFVEGQTLDTGDSPWSVALGHVDGDASVDMVVANINDSTISLFHNTASGGFASAGSVPTSLYPWYVTLGDLNGDGAEDLVLACYGSDTLTIHFNQGNGQFSEPVDLPAGFDPVKAIVANLDDDGDLDVAVLSNVNSFNSTVYVYLNQGNGTFEPANIYFLSDRTKDFGTVDFDNDGALDINTPKDLLHNLGNGTFEIVNDSSVPFGSILVDLDHDGDLDAVSSGTSSCGNETTSVGVADVNADSFADIVSITAEGVVAVTLNDGEGSFLDTGFTYGAQFAVVGNVNGDAHVDVVVAGWNFQVGYGLGDGTFDVANYNDVAHPDMIQLVDLDFDGDDDLVGAITFEDALTFLENDGQGNFTTTLTLATGARPRGLATGDWNHDGRVDVVVGHSFANFIRVFIGAETGGFLQGFDYQLGFGAETIATGYFNADKNLDLAIGLLNTTRLQIMLGQGDGTFELGETYPAGGNPRQVVAADVDANGTVDLVLAADQTVLVLRNAGNAEFISASYPFGSASSVAVADFDVDGDVDLAVANKLGSNVDLLLNDGAGHFVFQGSFGSCPGPTSVGVGDFDNDEDADLLVASAPYPFESDGGVSVLKNRTFGPHRVVGDCDCDRAISLNDYSTLNACFGGPAGGFSSASCPCSDLDADQDVDLNDFARSQLGFGQ